MLSEKVKEIAKEKHISLHQIEKDVGIAKGSISKWNVISPSFDKVVAVARQLDVDVNELVENASGE